MSNEAEQSTFLSRLQRDVFGDKGTVNIIAGGL